MKHLHPQHPQIPQLPIFAEVLEPHRHHPHPVLGGGSSDGAYTGMPWGNNDAGGGPCIAPPSWEAAPLTDWSG